MRDYITVLQTMRLANEEDIKDFRFLKTAVGLQELKGEVICGDNNKALECESQRDILLQRLTLLNAINGFASFQGEYKADYPKFTITKNEKDDLVVGFLENKRLDEFSQANGLLESTITIGNTVNGTFILNKAFESSKHLFVCRFGKFSIENYATLNVRGKVMESTVGCILGGGKISGRVLDIWMNKQKAEENRQIIDAQFSSLNAAKIYSEYDCRENIVEYNMGHHYEPRIFVYEGEETRSKIELLNMNDSEKIKQSNQPEELSQLAELLKKEISPDGLTVDIVLTRPDDIYKFEEKMPKDLKDVYDDVIEGRIEN